MTTRPDILVGNTREFISVVFLSIPVILGAGLLTLKNQIIYCREISICVFFHKHLALCIFMIFNFTDIIKNTHAYRKLSAGVRTTRHCLQKTLLRSKNYPPCSQKTLCRSKNYPPAEMEKRMRGIRCHVTSDSRRYLIVTKSKQEPQIGYHKCSNYLDWVRCHVFCNN